MKQRKFRKKPTAVDDAEEEEPTGMAVLPTQKQKPKQPKAPKPSRTGLLSFDEDASEAPSSGLRKQPGGQLRPSATKLSATVVPVAEKRSTYTQVSNTGMHAGHADCNSMHFSVNSETQHHQVSIPCRGVLS